MSARPSPSFKKASESFQQMWWNLKHMNQSQSPLKGAVYNFVIVVVVAAIVAVCLVLGPFLKPLLWASLIGAVLFPFKYSLSSTLKCWFGQLEENDSHLLVGVALAPIQALDAFGAYLTELFLRHKQLIIGGAVGLLMLRLFVTYAPKGALCALWRYIRWAHSLFTNVLSSVDYTVLIALVLVYVVIVFFLWKKDNSFYFMLLGQVLWVVIVAYCCSFLGALQVPVFLSTLTYAFIGVIIEYRHSTAPLSQTGYNESIFQRYAGLLDVSSFYGSPRSNTAKSYVISPILTDRSVATTSGLELIEKSDTDSLTKSTGDTDQGDTPRTKMHLNIKTSTDDPSAKKSQSEIYFKVLFLSCLVTILYKHVWMTFFAVVPILIYLINILMDVFGFKEYTTGKWREITKPFQDWIIIHHSAILPLCLPGVIRLNRNIHDTIRSTMKESIDTVSSIIMIVVLILTVLFTGIFCAVEIYSETIAVIELGNDVVNWTLYHRPELMDMFPGGMKESLDSAIENAYQYGRTGIETYVDELLKDADSEQRRKLKNQIVSIWDRLIQYWIDRNKVSFTGPQVPASAITDSIGEIVNNEAAQQGVIGWVKTNIGVLMEVMDSVWLIVKTNLNILTSILGTFLSMFLGGGQAVITFLFNVIIFLTALFYLLSSSEEKYAPLAATSYIGFSSGPKIAEAIETSISSVLIASGKLALFHGLFTWLTHTICGARVIFLPSVFAGILAAVPFLGTYWCSIPAFLELWLIQDRFTLGIILLSIHVLFPTSFVDPAIYADVNGGGHAYLTGLSIAGGMFWLGWEGAIFGPILLCLLVVIFNLTTSALKDSPITPHIRNPSNPEYRTT